MIFNLGLAWLGKLLNGSARLFVRVGYWVMRQYDSSLPTGNDVWNDYLKMRQSKIEERYK